MLRRVLEPLNLHAKYMSVISTPRTRPNPAPKSQVNKFIMAFLPKCSPFFNFEFLRVLGTAPYHGAEIADCLEVVPLLKPNDSETWYREWSRLAARAEATGRNALRTGDVTAARWAFLRACNYRRASEFMLHHNVGDARMAVALEQSTSDFKTACGLMEEHVEFLNIPYQQRSTLPGYLFLPQARTTTPNSNGKIPVVIISGGFDSTQEELYFAYVAGALPRGYAAVLFEGPGQGIVARRSEDRLHLRHDWEVVISAVLDEVIRLAEAHPDWNLDTNQIALLGPAMGAYFALRGATDHRIAACVSLDGFYDLREMMAKRMPGLMMRAIDEGWIGASVINWLIQLVGRLDFQARWETGHGMIACGISSPVGVLREFVTKYNLREPSGQSILERVKCPVLVTGAKDSLYFSVDAGARRIYNELRAAPVDREVRLWLPETPGQGSLQAKIGALASLHEVVFGWLDGVFSIRRTGLEGNGK